MGAEKGKIKLLNVEGVEVTEHSIRTGAYPISRPLNPVIRGKPGGPAAAFVQFLLGDVGQSLVTFLISLNGRLVLGICSAMNPTVVGLSLFLCLTLERTLVSLHERVEELTGEIGLEQEAARAGEAGRGFAVVANEVKSLASRSSEAAVGIADRLNLIRSEVEISVEELNRIEGFIERVGKVFAGVGSAVGEQSSAIEQIVQSVAGAASDADAIEENATHASNRAQETSLESQRIHQNSQRLFGLAATMSAVVQHFR